MYRELKVTLTTVGILLVAVIVIFIAKLRFPGMTYYFNAKTTFEKLDNVMTDYTEYSASLSNASQVDCGDYTVSLPADCTLLSNSGSLTAYGDSSSDCRVYADSECVAMEFDLAANLTETEYQLLSGLDDEVSATSSYTKADIMAMFDECGIAYPDGFVDYLKLICTVTEDSFRLSSRQNCALNLVLASMKESYLNNFDGLTYYEQDGIIGFIMELEDCYSFQFYREDDLVNQYQITVSKTSNPSEAYAIINSVRFI